MPAISKAKTERTRTRRPSRRGRRTILALLTAAGVMGPAMATIPTAPALARTTTISPLDYGAVAGDGLDDLAAFRAAVAAAKKQDGAVVVPAGTFNLSGALVLDSVVLRGQGAGRTVLVSTDPDSAAIGLSGNRPALIGVTHAVPDATVRTARLGNHNVVAESATDFRVLRNELLGGEGVGIMVLASSRGLIQANTVTDTLGDGIHLTGSSDSVIVNDNTVARTGDDGIAVVSYQSNSAPTREVLISRNLVVDGRSRGIAVVGGEKIGITENTVMRSANAGVYIAAEGEWNTRSVNAVHVARNRVVGSPSSPRSTHASMLVYSSTGYVRDVWFQANEVVDSPTTGFGSWVRRVALLTSGSVGRLLFTQNTVVNAATAPTRLLDGIFELYQNKGF